MWQVLDSACGRRRAGPAGPGVAGTSRRTPAWSGGCPAREHLPEAMVIRTLPADAVALGGTPWRGTGSKVTCHAATSTLIAGPRGWG